MEYDGYRYGGTTKIVHLKELPSWIDHIHLGNYVSVNILITVEYAIDAIHIFSP